MRKLKNIFISLFFVAVGIVIGGYLFSHSQPRSLLALNRCDNCLSTKDLTGLLVSVGIQKLPGIVPFVEFETNKTVAIKLPSKKAHAHYIIIPKKDIKDIGELSGEDVEQFLSARGFANKYRRLHWDGPSHTLVAHMARDCSDFIHPEWNRPVSVREAARLQSFPDSFRLAGSPFRQLRFIGNAIPPLLAKAVAGVLTGL